MRSGAKIALIFFALLFAPASAQASGFLLLGPQITLPAMQLLSSQSRCVIFSYDLNGNRIAQAVEAADAGPIRWGAGTFGCFNWNR